MPDIYRDVNAGGDSSTGQTADNPWKTTKGVEIELAKGRKTLWMSPRMLCRKV
ncbi:MAG: hypothetical protein QGH60_08215 [Phycisphaerae bacterium]|jgi:hypothetical protein|nr:hypothetical protein [Phycisphaerae bacterium]